MNLAVYVLLFTVVGVGFILVHLIAGKVIRPNKPGAEKGTIYECGEPTIGSAWIQFDLRFYVVALLFVIFDVEVAFFFPWAEVFGRANDVAALQKPTTPAGYQEFCQKVLALAPAHAPQPALPAVYERLAKGDMRQFDADRAMVDVELSRTTDNPIQQANNLAWMAFCDILVFFGVLLVGFAYLWRRGDLAWVRSVTVERPVPLPSSAPAVAPPQETKPVLATSISAH